MAFIALMLSLREDNEGFECENHKSINILINSLMSFVVYEGTFYDRP